VSNDVVFCMDHGDARDGKLLESTVVLSFVGVVVPEVAVAAAAVAVLGLADCRDEALYECSRQDCTRIVNATDETCTTSSFLQYLTTARRSGGGSCGG